MRLDRIAPLTCFLSEKAEGLVRKFNMGQKMIVRGIVSNAAANAPVDQAVVQILGSIQTTQTDASGRFVFGADVY